MPYSLSVAKDAGAIKEQEYASAKEVTFTAFTSCIGVIAKKSDTLTAVHLVMVDKSGNKFDTTAAATVIGVLPKDPDAVTIFGCISVWENPKNEVQAAFQKLTAAYSSLKKYQQYSWGDGTYGAKVTGDAIEMTF